MACRATNSQDENSQDEQDEDQQSRQHSRYQQGAKATHPVRVEGEHLTTPLPGPLSRPVAWE
jgi:hypothetical protein